MSKAFTKETDDNSDGAEVEPQDLSPRGTKNYITPIGAKRLQDELTCLLDIERPKIVSVVSWAASNGDRSENADYIYGKRRLREIDRRIRFLSKRLEIAEIIEPSTQKSDVVVFGATVTVEREDRQKKVYRIVGVDQSNARVGDISWISPVGKALLRHKVGDLLIVQTPQGEQEITILKIEFIPE